MYIAIILTLAGLAWFALAQRRPDRPVTVSPCPDAPDGAPAAREGDQQSGEDRCSSRLRRAPGDCGCGPARWQFR